MLLLLLHVVLHELVLRLQGALLLLLLVLPVLVCGCMVKLLHKHPHVRLVGALAARAELGAVEDLVAQVRGGVRQRRGAVRRELQVKEKAAAVLTSLANNTSKYNHATYE